jgi:hypothetical protein
MPEKRTTNGAESGQASLIRVGGLAIVVGMAIHIVLNVVLKEFPPDEATGAELQEYLSREAGSWGVIHGFRYVAFLCIVLFAAGLFSRTCCARSTRETGWGVVGLLGAAIFVTNGVITNGVEILAFLNVPLISQSEDLFWLLYRLTRILFTAEVVTWSVLILGFSVAGWRSATIPRWLSALGFLQVSAGMLSGVFITSALAGEWASIPLDVASLAGLLWFMSAGVYLLVRGDSV